MTLAKGDTLAKLDPATKGPIPADRESYTNWEVNGLTPTFGMLTDLPAPIANGLKELGIQIEEAAEDHGNVFQIVLLRKVH